ncbi:tetratricopeptide (TPR) repeat protein [Catenulispora sp. EB89]|uniref:CHAT domain-containing protein n=1 Tax=Catenulispora sp. EB89 TaxID=3156257 RepID=UPI0035168204
MDEEQDLRRAAEAGDAIAMVNLGRALELRSDPEEAERWYRRVVDDAGAYPVARAHAAHRIAGFAEQRGDVGETDAWLRQTVGIITEADYDPTLPRLLSSALIKLAEMNADAGNAEYAEQLYRAAAESTEEADAYHALGKFLRGRGDSTEATGWYRKGAEKGHMNSMLELTDLAFERGDEAEVRYWTMESFSASGAMKYKPEEDSDPDVLEDHACRLTSLYEISGHRPTLDEALVQFRASLALTPEGDPTHAGRLANLGSALHTLFERTGEWDVLVESVSLGRAAVATALEDDPDRAMYLGNLGLELREMFNRTGQLEWLVEAVKVGRAAVATSRDDAGRAADQLNLAVSLCALFARTGRQEALLEAIEFARAAVAATNDDHRRGTVLSTLGTALLLRYQNSGDEAVLAEATEVARQAVAATPSGHTELSKYLSALGLVLRTTFQHTGQLAALVEAVEVERRALDALPEGSPNRAGHHNELGINLMLLAERTNDIDTLVEAVNRARAAAGDASADDSSRAIYLSNLGNVLREVFDRSDRLEYLVEAVSVTRAAVEATPVDDPDRAVAASNLGGKLRLLAERTNRQDAASEAVEIAREAVNATPAGHPARSRRLNLLGEALEVLSELRGQPHPSAEARRAFREAAAHEAGETSSRIIAFRHLARSAARVGDAQDGLACIEAAIELVDLLAPARLARADREHHLGEVSELASEAAAAALDAGRPERAVELLERTRGVLAADSLGLRGDDLTRLREQYPELADRLDQTRQRIDALDRLQSASEMNAGASGPPVSVTESDRQLAAQRTEAHGAWQSLLDAIRALPGFAEFFRAPTIATLVRHAHAGPVVYVSVSTTRADALILTEGPDPVVVVPLPGVTRDAVSERLVRLTQAGGVIAVRDLAPASGPVDVQGEILAVLAWLWDAVALPVLARLGYTEPPADGADLPRVWWCPVGAMTFLPLHAAGRHVTTRHVTTGSADGPAAAPSAVLDLVVSSYTSTVRALPRKGDPQPRTAPSSTLVVSVPDLPGAELPGVVAETDAIRALAPQARVLRQPTREGVLDALPSHRIVHFACHGYFDAASPARSSLILTDHETAPLTLADIRDLRIDAELAYLSACDTATSTWRLANESLHITGAFHLAGYRNVVGTLWPIDDGTASWIAADFYRHLTDGGTIPPDTARIAQALHHAVNQVRARCPDVPSLWAAYTHTGA